MAACSGPPASVTAADCIQEMPTGFWARLVLEADIDEIPALQHLARRLGEPGFIPVGRRQAEKAGQEQQKTQCGQDQNEFGLLRPCDGGPSRVRGDRAHDADALPTSGMVSAFSRLLRQISQILRA